MGEFFRTQAPGSRFVPDASPKKTVSFAVDVQVDTLLVDRLKELLSNGNVRHVRKFLVTTFTELRNVTLFNLMLISANTAEEQNVNMDVILKESTELPIVRLSDSKGDFCVVRFDR